jgi:hypothetical protein
VADLNGVEMNLAARKLVRDFFTDWRSRGGKTRKPNPGVHAAVYVRPMRRGRNANKHWHMLREFGGWWAHRVMADGVSPVKFNVAQDRLAAGTTGRTYLMHLASGARHQVQRTTGSG